MADYMIAQMKDLKKGKYVIIDGIPCKVVDIQVSRPGKHGSAKARVTAVGIFNNEKKQLLKPVDAEVHIPIVQKKFGQIVADTGDQWQVMDLETYETFEVKKNPEISVNPGDEVEYMIAMGQVKVVRKR